MARGADTGERLCEDPLFLACTRPAMFAGAPMEAVGVNLIVTATVFLMARSPFWLLIGPALHLVARAICQQDPNAFRVLGLGLGFRLRARTAWFWGGASRSPLQLRRRFKRRGIARG